MDMKNKGSSGLSVGISRDKSQSKIKSYAEGFERYYSSYTNHDQKHSTHSIFGDTEKSIVESITGCEGDFVIGNTYESYSIYELRKIEVGTIQTGCKHNIPGTIVQYPHIDNTIYPANSSGIAAGPSYTDAIISGYLELIEKHYIIDGWLHTWSPMQINRETLPIDIQHILSQIEHDFKGKISILCTGIDPIPGILILFENTERIKIGAACKESTHDAVHKAISEILTGLLFDKENRGPISRIEDVHSVVDHNNYYKVAEHRKHLLYLQDGPIIDYGSIPMYTDTKSLINTSIQAESDSLYVADLTSEESRKYGVYIVRVMSSKLLPIGFGNNGKIPLLKTHIGTLDANKKIHFSTNTMIPLIPYNSRIQPCIKNPIIHRVWCMSKYVSLRIGDKGLAI